MDLILAAAGFLIRLEFLGPWLSNRDQNEEPPALKRRKRLGGLLNYYYLEAA